MATLELERRLSDNYRSRSSINEGQTIPQRESKGENYTLFVERYLEKPVYCGDPQMLTLPTACTIKGVPVVDDW